MPGPRGGHDTLKRMEITAWMDAHRESENLRLSVGSWGTSTAPQ